MSDFLSAQGDLVTDRPDQTESSSTVGHGTIQLETGFVFERFRDLGDQEDRDVSSLFSSLVRIGFGKDIELRGILSYDRVTPVQQGQELNGASAPAVGLKLRLWGEDGWIPEAAFLGHLTLPIAGKEEFRPEFIAPDFRFSFAHSLSDRLSIGYNVGMEWDGATPEAAAVYTLALGIGLTGSIGAFLEVYGAMPEVAESSHYFDGGITWLITPDLQADVSGGINIDGRGSFSFLNFGLSWRIPRLF